MCAFIEMRGFFNIQDEGKKCAPIREKSVLAYGKNLLVRPIWEKKNDDFPFSVKNSEFL